MTNEEQNANPTSAPETSAVENPTTPPPAKPAAPPAAASPAATAAPPAAAATPEQPAKPAMAIGSQRDPANKSLSPSAPKAVQAAVANPISLKEKPAEKIVVEEVQINSSAGLSEDIDAEIEAALNDISMDDVVSVTETAKQEIEPGTRVKVPVTKIHEDNVFVKLEGQLEGVATLHHFKEAPKEGDMVELIVRSLSGEDGLYELAVPGAAIGASDWEDLNEGDVVEASVTGSNFRVEDFTGYVGKKLTCVAVEVKPEKRRLVLSHRAILDRENEEKRAELLKELEAGQIREGVVTKLMDFGAFCDLGGVEGLIHISKLSWSRIKHPSEAVKEGDGVRVKVESIDLESNRISLSLRDTTDHPWQNVSDDYSVDDIVTGKVTRIADFGAFVQLMPGVEGLVHISELSYKRVTKVSSVISEGQDLEVKILSIDKDDHKISLSHKACLTPPPKKVDGKPVAEEADAPARDLAVPARAEPLKGGNDRKSGGESIGLKW